MMGRALKRWRWAIAAALSLALALGYAFWPEATPVDIASVSKGPMSVGVTDDGVTRERDLFVVSAPVTGLVSRITLEVGDRVAKGQLITRMTGRPSPPLDERTRETLRASLASAQAAHKAAAAALGQARRDLARAEALSPRGFISRAQLETARTRVATDQATLAQSSAEVQRVSASLAGPGRSAGGAPVAVTAPVSGSVLLIPEKSEGIIAEGTPLITLGDPAKIEVLIDLLSREAVRVHPGDRVEITQWGGPAPLIGHVKYIEPYGRLKISALGIEEQRVNVVIGFDPAAASEAARLGHGYQVDATIIVWSKPDVLRVPVGALFRGGDGGWRVYVVDHGRARERAVRLDHVNDEFAEVISGLAAGETIVLNPANDLRAGDRVKPR